MVYRKRFLRSFHITALIGGSSQHLLRRLQLLYHHGYLERPRAQIDFYRQGGSRQIIYGLGRKGSALLKKEMGLAFRGLRLGEQNRSVGRIYLDHAIAVSDFMVDMELACRKRGGVRLISQQELTLPGLVRPSPFKWHVKINGHVKIGIIPDRVFALKTHSGNTAPTYYFLEIDRGTTPVMRKNLTQSSFYRKLLAYEATWAQKIHLSRFGFYRFRVLTVTTSAKRMNSMLDACSQLKKGHGLFLFIDQASLKDHADILSLEWISGKRVGTITVLG